MERAHEPAFLGPQPHLQHRILSAKLENIPIGSDGGFDQSVLGCGSLQPITCLVLFDHSFTAQHADIEQMLKCWFGIENDPEPAFLKFSV
jgi:hypothetical protein